MLILVLIEAAFRYGIRGGLWLTAASVPVLVGYEALRSQHFDERYEWTNVTLQLGIMVMIALIVGWLVQQVRSEAQRALERAAESEDLRDELGRRADLLDAANRCARALGSSLEVDEAFGAFIRELRSLVPFDRTAIILMEHGEVVVMATAGHLADEVLRPGEALPPGALIEEVLRTGETVYRRDMSDHAYPEEKTLVEIGLRSRVAAPLLLGARPIGMLSILRNDADAFGPDEIELASLLGRLVATAVQNIRSYEAERETVEELRRLSALRADFVSLVSHELRSPMAAVIGAARTLQDRWRELTPVQRTSFLALIGDETNRLATLIGDVLDTSRIEAGTFSYSFTDVDVGELVRDTVATAVLAQDEVGIVTNGTPSLPHVRGDRERLRQVLTNLVENAVKYSQAGGEVSVRTWSENGRVLVVGRGSRSRHPTRPAGADLREVRPRPRRARQAGHRARALHRALDRRGARRHAGRPLRSRSGRDVHARAAAGRRSAWAQRQAGAEPRRRPSSLPSDCARFAIARRSSGGSSSSASPR